MTRDPLRDRRRRQRLLWGLGAVFFMALPLLLALWYRDPDSGRYFLLGFLLLALGLRLIAWFLGRGR